ncbi:NUDIX hydrolase [Candidatus Nomurabacteria bacterium]|nr:NUDIX hydrolase [Candidatus Nomurabacteria bacterium]
MEQFFNQDNELVHGSVGVIVQNQNKEILLFKRVKYPFLWTIPAGHLDKDEDPKQAATRELHEETQINASELRSVFAGEIRGDSCVGGADIHYWHAYVYQASDDVEPIIEAEEGREWGWFVLSELPELTMPVGYLLSLSEVCVTLE